MLARDEGSHVAAARPVAGAQRPHALSDLLDELVGDGVDREDDRDRHAALAGGAEARVDGGIRSEVEVGIRKDQHVVLRAAESLHALAVTGRGLVHVAGDGGGADERDGADIGVLEERVDRLLVAVHDVEDAIGEPRLLEQGGHPVGRARVLLGGLQDDGVAGGERDREEPQRHHRREVEGADDADDAERLTHRVDVDAGRDVLGVGALRQVAEAARELDDLHAAGDLAVGVGEHLAVLGGEDLGELVLAGVEQLAEGEHHRLALGDGGVAPPQPSG